MLKIGLLGAARIAPKAVIEPAQRRDDVSIVAVSAARPGAAAEFASQYAIPVAYDTYDALIDDGAIDLVYNALPPRLHAEWSIKALEAGKHVLCEKPFAMNPDQARAMITAARANGRRIIEAFHDRYHPVYAYALAQRDAGSLGDILELKAHFKHSIPFDADEFRHNPGAGGGALMDLGCYPIHWCRNFMEEEPQVLDASARITAAGIDEDIAASLLFPSGIKAEIQASMEPGWDHYARFIIIGSKGTLTLKNSILAHLGHSVHETINGQYREFTLAGNTSYDHQLDALVSALANGAPLPCEGADSVGNIQVICDILATAGVERRA